GRSTWTEQVRAVVAIHTGTAIVHAVGRAEHAHYGVLGAAVNLASRLEWEGKELGLTTVLSGSTVAALNGASGSLHLVTRKKLRGLSNRIEIWSTDSVGPADSIDLSATEPRPNPTPQSGVASPEPMDWRPLAGGTLVAGVFIASLTAIVWLRSGEEQFTSILM